MEWISQEFGFIKGLCCLNDMFLVNECLNYMIIAEPQVVYREVSLPNLTSLIFYFISCMTFLCFI